MRPSLSSYRALFLAANPSTIRLHSRGGKTSGSRAAGSVRSHQRRAERAWACATGAGAARAARVRCDGLEKLKSSWKPSEQLAFKSTRI